jgi:hypothetical protein
MKTLKLLTFYFAFTFHSVLAQEEKQVTRLNFLVSPRLDHFDAAPFSFQAQAKLMQLFHKKKMYVIIARSSEDMASQVIEILEKRKAVIGNIWFDSHGHFTRRRSLFEIGNDEFNYMSIRDSCFIIHLKKLASYCDTNTNAGIGSCYGGATYSLPAVEEFPEQRMNGDSLMIGLSEVLNNASVYGSESFVMTGPGILNASYAFSGNPGRKKFRDHVYEPVWEKLGEWNCYSGKEKKFTPPVTVSLHQDGRISSKHKNYLEFEKNREKWVKKLSRLKRGNYNIANLYQEGNSTKPVGKGK